MERKVLVESYSPCFVSNVNDENNALSMEEWLASGLDCLPMIPYEQELGFFCNGELIAFIPERSNHECPRFSK